ncbi:glycosyltransferase family 1 protein [Arthrobacter sp. Y-9]|uniref:glycosyltransferase family 4 protein n=1 Tax=Arthrobacter sp. Y-9 TaxID=3039385 RepID=UPI00241C2600|nr:glycosyltransferase family 1 protein [Arthrobacter sp. Y-9]WFR84727.1 glycosyltransferase family 1 protein [Arthrobacter sp. Y-9]
MIVVNCRFLTQKVTGVQRFAEEIVTALAPLRDDLVLVAPPGPLRETSIAGVSVQQWGKHQGHLWEQWDLPRALARTKRDPLLLSLTNTGPILRRRQVVTHHDVTYVRQPQTYSSRFRAAYRLLSTLTLRPAAAVITVSEFSRQEIASVYHLDPAKITVVPNAAAHGFHQEPAGEADTPYFLAVSSLLPHKNIDLLVRAFHRYAESTGSSTRLKLVGSTPETVSRTNKGRTSTQAVEYLGRVDDDELRRLYAAARAFVFPSRYEGFGIPPLEAQASGVPVLASDAPALREVLGSSARYFARESEASLVEGLRELDTDLTLRQDLIDLGRKNTARYSWARSAAALDRLLNTQVDTRSEGERA